MRGGRRRHPACPNSSTGVERPTVAPPMRADSAVPAIRPSTARPDTATTSCDTAAGVRRLVQHRRRAGRRLPGDRGDRKRSPCQSENGEAAPRPARSPAVRSDGNPGGKHPEAHRDDDHPARPGHRHGDARAQPGGDRDRYEAQIGDGRPAARGGHVVTRSLSPSNVFWPMPDTLMRSSMAVKRPFAARQARIRAAIAGPTRGRVSSVGSSAVLMFTFPPMAPTPPAVEAGMLCPDRGHDDLLPIAEEAREIEARGVGRGSETTRGGHRIHRPIAIVQRVETRIGDLPENVHVDQRRGRPHGVRPGRVHGRPRPPEADGELEVRTDGATTDDAP